jgi:Uma2 family endonuclease
MIKSKRNRLPASLAGWYTQSVMSTLAAPPLPSLIVYPDSDGLPMAENTLQYQWIVTIVGGLRHLFDEDPNVFVAGDLFWYPVEGHPEIRVAPDALVAFGRPRGHRGSYCQWLEAGIAPQVVFEVLSPGNRFGEMSAKFDFYSLNGVEEYYLFNPDPERLELSGFLRKQGRLVEIEPMHGHKSPRLGIRFEMDEQGLTLIRPDGRAFITFEELARQEEQERQRADREHDHAERANKRAEEERDRAKQADDRAKQADDRAKRADDRAKQERERADDLQRELDRLRQQSMPKPGVG